MDVADYGDFTIGKLGIRVYSQYCVLIEKVSASSPFFAFWLPLPFPRPRLTYFAMSIIAGVTTCSFLLHVLAVRARALAPAEARICPVCGSPNVRLSARTGPFDWLFRI